MLAKPFSRGVIMWGDPIYVPKKLDEEGLLSARNEIESSLNYITQEADRLCGQVPVEPAEENNNAKSGEKVN